MYKHYLAKLKKSDKSKIVISLGASILFVILATLLIIQLLKPERSVESYCKIYSQEKARLEAMSSKSNPYPSGVFNVKVVDAAEIANSLGKLSRVAPKDIESEIISLQKLYQDIHDNPSHAVTNALNGGVLDDSLKEWTESNCDGEDQ